MGAEEIPEIRESLLEGRVLPHPWLARPWRCWHDLQHDRAYGHDLVGASMGKIRGVARPMPIPWTALDAWCNAHGVIGEDRVDLIFLVRAMDSVFVRFRNGKLTEEMSRFIKG